MTAQTEMPITPKKLLAAPGKVSPTVVASKFGVPPRVSVVLPAHNETLTIRDMITQYFREIGTRLPVEFIVAEDGSVDGRREIISSLKNELPIVLLTDQRRKGKPYRSDGENPPSLAAFL